MRTPADLFTVCFAASTAPRAGAGRACLRGPFRRSGATIRIRRVGDADAPFASTSV